MTYCDCNIILFGEREIKLLYEALKSSCHWKLNEVTLRKCIVPYFVSESHSPIHEETAYNARNVCSYCYHQWEDY